MITYTCDICGKPMPSDYQRPDKRHSRDTLPTLCGADDVCMACERAGASVKIRKILPRAWKEAAAADSAPAPQSQASLLREHDVKALADLTDAELKRKVVAQVKAYRDAHGLGCFGKLAMADWQRIAVVMDRIETEEVKPNA